MEFFRSAKRFEVLSSSCSSERKSEAFHWRLGQKEAAAQVVALFSGKVFSPPSINSGGAIIAAFISKQEEGEAAVEDVLTLAVAPVQKQQVFSLPPPGQTLATELNRRVSRGNRAET